MGARAARIAEVLNVDNMFNLILWSISFLTITIYLLYILYRYGVQPSISATYYKIKHKAIFSFVLLITAFPLMILSSTGLMFFGGSALLFVATAAAYMGDDGKPDEQDNLTNKVHVYSAYAAVLLTTLSIIIDFDMWYMTLPLIVLAITIALRVVYIPNRVWWIEIVAFMQLYITLLISKVL